EWPAASWEALRRSGVLGWAVPREYGGEERRPPNLLDGYGQLAGACLTTCFLLSQRDAACRRPLDHAHEALPPEMPPPLASCARCATVGLSQLPTARQHVKPILMARLDGDRIILNGRMPWVTGAAHADHFVTGAVCEDGRQVLLVVPRCLTGVEIGPPL